MMDWLKNILDSADIDFVGKRMRFGAVSAALVFASWAAFALVGPNWGIDFTGGTEIHIGFQEEMPIGELRDTLQTLGIPSGAVQEVGGDDHHEFKIRIKDATFGADQLETQVTEAITATFGADWATSIDFNNEVGARFNVRYSGERTLPSALEDALSSMDGVKVEEGREDNELVVKLPGLSAQIEKELRGAMGDGRQFEVLAVDAVGPRVGESLRRQGMSSLLATLGLVLIYIAFRFDIAYAPGAIVALIHDVSVTVGLFILLDREFNLSIVGALLTIVGYSLNDTIVIFDRIRENRDRYRREDLGGLINVSINETLTRTIATSTTTAMAIAAFLWWGGDVLFDFVLAMLCGVVIGTYSTMFVASPMILWMERMKPRLAALVAIDTGDDEEGEDIPDQFLSASEKRRRERERLEAEASDID